MRDIRERDADDAFDIEILRDVDAVQVEWKQLEREGLLTPFQTRAWLNPFYRELAPRLNAKPVFVLVRDKSSREPAMLLPLCARRYYGIVFVQFADLGVCDYNAPILAKSFNPSPMQWRKLWRDIVTKLNVGSILRLKNLPISVHGRPNPLVQNETGSASMDVASWGVKLTPTVAEFRKSILEPSFAKEMAKKTRRVAKRGEIEYVLAQTPEDKRTVFDLMARQRQARCDEMGRSNLLARKAYRRFYESVLLDPPDAPASLSCFKVGGEIVGTVFALRGVDALHVLMSTFEGGEWKSCSLGNVIIQTAIERCIDDGLGFFDLTLGNEGYKQNFGATSSALHIVLRPLTPLGALAIFAMNFTLKFDEIWKRLTMRVNNKTRFGLQAEANVK